MSSSLSPRIELVRPAGAPAQEVPDIFANQMRMGVTLTDFTLIFSVIAESGPTGAVNKDRAIIHLAPGMLKQLLLNTQMAVKAYEDAIAEIPIPKQIQQQLDQIGASLRDSLRAQMDGPVEATIVATAPDR